MKQRMYQRKNIAFVPSAYAGKNKSGWEPAGDLVCVLIDVVDGMLGTKGLIQMTQSEIDTQNSGSTSGVIVELGPDAFLWSADRKRPMGEKKPKVGDRVFFVRYAGEWTMGDDNKQYSIMSDNSIVGIYRGKSQ